MNKNIFLIILTSYFFTFTLSNLNLTYDRYAVQFLAIGILNLISFAFFFNRFSFKEFLDNVLHSKPLIFYSGFIIISLLSITVANNKTESLVVLSQYLSFFFVFLALTFISQKSNINFVKLFMQFCLVALTLESLFISSIVVNDVLINGNEFKRAVKYSGFAANNNIAAFSLVCKLPILLFFIFKAVKKSSKVLLSLILFAVVFCLLILLSRGAFLAFTFVVILALSVAFSYKVKNFFSSTIIILSSITIGYLSTSNFINNTSSYDILGERISSIQITSNDASYNERATYYIAALESIFKNPFLGIGVGNWKIESIKYSSKNITGYRIPFHAHNDFLQVGAESGILALSFFIFFIFYPFYKFFKNFKHNHLHIVLLLSLSVFIFDSLINFPISRPISHIFLLFLLTALNNLKYDYEG